MKRKGQLEIGINIMVILVFLILLIISLVTYFKFSYSGIKETNQEILDEKFSTLINSVIEMPEFKCSFRNSEKECLDVEKLWAFNGLSNNDKSKYLDEFGINGLNVKIVYPVVEDSNGNEIANEVKCLTINDHNCDTIELLRIKDEGLKYTTPVSLYYPKEREYRLGKMEITAEI